MSHDASFGRRHRGRWSWVGLIAAFGLAILQPVAAAAQTGTVEGRVIAAGGGPIAGAQVTVERTSLGTRTGDDGRFTLLVPAGSRTIRVLAIGYKVGSVTVNVLPSQTATTNMELTRSVLRLDEVVITGTAGETRRREMGNSVAHINMAAEVKEPPANMDQLLQARAAGLSVIQTGASAGAGAQIRLRGVVSVNQSNQPIIYIDGIRVRSEGYARNGPTSGADFTGRGANIQVSPLNDINPADIERIEILKGAAASTLYGTEASAGVIQIFTRKGSRRTRPRWNLEVDQGLAITRPFGPEHNRFVNLKPPDSVEVVNGELRIAEKRSVTDGLCHPNDDLTDAIPVPNARCSWVRNGYRQKYSGSVAGGFDQFQYFVSALWEDLDGILPQDNEKRVATRGNFSFDVSEPIRVDLNTAYTNYRIRNTPSGNNAQGLLLNVYRAERNYRGTSDPAVLDSLLNQEITTELDRLITGGTVHYTPTPWFHNRFSLGYDLANQENRNLRPFGFQGQPLGVLFDEQNKYTTLTADYAGNVEYRLTESFEGTFSFGGQSITEEHVRTHAFGRDFAGPGEPTVSSAASHIAAETRLRVINAGFFLQNVFKLSERYFLTGGVRFDGNSAFGDALGLQAYPKVALSYVVSDEGFWPEALGEMKLRAALGYAGRAPGSFDKLRTWNPVASGGVPGFLPANVGDTLVGPERTREIELGADAGFFNNRLAAEFTWYHRLTTDALMNVRQIPSLGFLASQAANVGELENRGMELTLNATVLDAANFGWELGGTVYTNKSRVLDLGGSPPFSAIGGWVQGPDTLADGRVIYFPIAGAKGIRIKNKDEIAVPDTACAVPGGQITQGTYAGATELCASDGLSIFGPQQPTLILGMNTTIRLPAGFTLSARGEYQGGSYVDDGASGAALSRSVRWPTCSRAHLILDQGGTENELTAWERIACVAANYDGRIHWQKADFFKLRDVTLSVPVGSVLPQVETATLRVSVQNWVRWYNDDLRIFDPEMGNRDSLSDQSRGFSEHVPPPATVTVSLRVAF